MIKISADYGKVRISELNKPHPALWEFTRLNNQIKLTFRSRDLPPDVAKEWWQIARLVLLGSTQTEEISCKSAEKGGEQKNKKWYLFLALLFGVAAVICFYLSYSVLVSSSMILLCCIYALLGSLCWAGCCLMFEFKISNTGYFYY